MKSKSTHRIFLSLGLFFMTWMLAISIDLADKFDLTKTQAAADKGDAEAQFLLGRPYFRGEGVPQDYAKAHH